MQTGLVASEAHHQADTAAKPAAATATDKMAMEKRTLPHPAATTGSTADHMTAHPAIAKVVQTGKNIVKKGHHHRSNINVKRADDLSDELNKMTCPSSVPAA